MSETGLAVVAGSLLAAVGLGYWLGRSSTVPLPHRRTEIAYPPLPVKLVSVPGQPVADEVQQPGPPPIKPRAPHAPSETEMYYREVEREPREYW